MCNTKVNRILAACHVGNQNAANDIGPDVDVSKTVEDSSGNLVPTLNKVMKRIQLVGDLTISWTVELKGQAYAKSEQNDLFETDVRTMSKNMFLEVAQTMLEVCKSVDADPNYKVAVFQTFLEKQCQAWGSYFSMQLKDKVNQYMASNKAIKAGYRKYQIRCIHDVSVDCIVIVASIGATAASWGAAGPVAVVAIVRSTVGLVQKCGYMAIEAGTLADMIDGYFNALAVLMVKIDEDSKSPNMKIAWNSGVEIGLGAAAGILNIDVPSVTVIGGQMKTLEGKLKGMHTERLKCGEKMAKLRVKIEAYKNNIAQNAATLDKEELAKHEAAVEQFKSSRETIDIDSKKMFMKIEKLLDRQTEFEEQLKDYKAGQIKLARQSKLVFGFVTSVGLGIGSGGGHAIESGMGAMVECLRAAEDLLKDRLLH